MTDDAQFVFWRDPRAWLCGATTPQGRTWLSGQTPGQTPLRASTLREARRTLTALLAADPPDLPSTRLPRLVRVCAGRHRVAGKNVDVVRDGKHWMIVSTDGRPLPPALTECCDTLTHAMFALRSEGCASQSAA